MIWMNKKVYPNKNYTGQDNINFLFFFRSIVSKPREFAHLIKNKFGSADNISSLSKYLLCCPLLLTCLNDGSKRVLSAIEEKST